MTQEINTKIDKFSGKEEDFPEWRRNFRNAMNIANLQDMLAAVAPVAPQGRRSSRGINQEKKHESIFQV